MQETVEGFANEVFSAVASDPLMFAAGLASLVGLFMYWSYGGFINENYQRIKWFRRLFLPHITRLLHKIDEENENIDLDGAYVETQILESEHAFDLYLRESSRDYLIPLTGVSETLIDNHFRPEVILASLGTSPEGYVEVGNFALTAPEKKKVDMTGIARLNDIITMFVSRYQLHVRIFFDPEKHRLRFYAHHEYNPYNPFHAKDHLEAKKFNPRKGVKMFKEYADELERYGVEIVE